MKKSILVTGAAGFIGFHVAQALAERGDLVIGIDNFNAYYSPLLKKNRASLLEANDIPVHCIDICDLPSLQNLHAKYQFTHIVHLAAQAGVRYAQKHPEVYVKSNLEGFLSILELCRHSPHITLVYASSSSVYGCNEKLPFSIEDQTDSPSNLYAATKKANELMAYSYHHLYGFPATGLRFFTVYGPWGRPDMAYYSFTEAIMEGKPITLFNQGQMKRDFTYIDDIVNGTIAALDLGAAWEVFNLGNHSPEPLLKFVEILEQEIGKKAEKIFVEQSRGEMEVTYADIAHSQKLLGFSPSTSLEKGLSQFVSWYRSYKSNSLNAAGKYSMISPAIRQ